MTRWHYYKIYLQHDRTANQRVLTDIADNLLRDICQPLLEAAEAHVERWFFIRYIDTGYHIRFRVYGDTDALQRHVFEPLKTRLSLLYEERNIPYSLSDMVQEAVYQPESIKYGTGPSLSLAEEHFQYSSEMILQVLQLEAETNIPRSLWVAALIDLAMQQILPDPAERAFFLLSYATYWLYGQPERISRHLDTQYERKRALLQQLPRLQQQALFEDWAIHWKQLYRELTYFEKDGLLQSPVLAHLQPQLKKLPVASPLSRYPLSNWLVMPNFLHLVSNRAGVGIHQEAQLAYYLYRLLNVQYDQEPVKLLLEPDLQLKSRGDAFR